MFKFAIFLFITSVTTHAIMFYIFYGPMDDKFSTVVKSYSRCMFTLDADILSQSSGDFLSTIMLFVFFFNNIVIFVIVPTMVYGCFYQTALQIYEIHNIKLNTNERDREADRYNSLCKVYNMNNIVFKYAKKGASKFCHSAMACCTS
jgi:hypothetical protein